MSVRVKVFLFFDLLLLSALTIVTWAAFLAGGYFFTMKPVGKVSWRASETSK